MFVILNMKQFCMFVGMSIIHDHNKCHTTPWNYSVLIILTTNEQNYIQNSHAHSVLHNIYINTYIYTYSVVQQCHLRFSHSHLLVRNPHNLKLKTSYRIPIHTHAHTHHAHTHARAYAHAHTHLTPTTGHKHYDSINLIFSFKEHELQVRIPNPGSFKNYQTRPAIPFSEILHIYQK